ncbi:hypothetical protein MNBD_GAMMA13-263 [hydrothermal vent metagenome]|uniref:Uncharacterized protein n=1 Tax=hydrothermal vent metagenome TaxID=652676 RepID=A0A3B0YSL7_9ZZZZ
MMVTCANNVLRLLATTLVYFSLTCSVYGEQKFTLRFEPTPDGSLALNGSPRKNSGIVAQRPSQHEISIKATKNKTNTPQRERFPQLSKESLVVVGIDAEGNEIINQAVADPRLVRGEVFNQNGSIQSNDSFYLTRTDLNVSLETDAKLTSLKVYQLDWDGKNFSRSLLGETTLP